MTTTPRGWENEDWWDEFVIEFVYEPENNWLHSVNGKRLEEFISRRIASAVEARENKIGEHILAIGHNDECMFCGFKDKFATSIINPSKE